MKHPSRFAPLAPIQLPDAVVDGPQLPPKHEMRRRRGRDRDGVHVGAPTGPRAHGRVIAAWCLLSPFSQTGLRVEQPGIAIPCKETQARLLTQNFASCSSCSSLDPYPLAA